MTEVERGPASLCGLPKRNLLVQDTCPLVLSQSSSTRLLTQKRDGRPPEASGPRRQQTHPFFMAGVFTDHLRKGLSIRLARKFHNVVWKSPNEIPGQPNTSRHSRESIVFLVNS